MSPAPLSWACRFRRLTPTARIAAWLGGCVAASLLWCLLLLATLQPGLEVFSQPLKYPLAQNLYLGGTYLILLGGAVWTWQRMQGESLRALGLAWQPGTAAKLGLGLALGLASLGGLFAFEVQAKLLIWESANWAATSAGRVAEVALVAVAMAVAEEVLFRGFVLQTLRRGFDSFVAMAGSAWLYALVHFLRFDLVWHQVALPFAGLFLAGLLLAWVTLRTRSIWLAAGLHTGWVFLFLLTDQLHLLGYPPAHNWLTGSGYPLGSWLGIGLLLALWGALYLGFKRRAA